ncbi:hypothetical protein SAMN04489727_5735 [Amycolatopsis tolypomycina]|uniref:Uncharacterized protein n=1 Tax=Amycolatopsis tolypomycina TaxID=208445 RepID=A0A1H4WPQ2_9PSEU|nr:hypothetical protein [Amycolatopsis tolypomycina]SEC95312.1 hypothetical protein SAMN04489727_5735 [Amycolatopsis tolypomycina]
MTEDHADIPPAQGSGEIVGGRLLDAADPTHGVRPDACLVCRTTDRRQLHQLSLYPPDLAAAGLPAGARPVVCLTHYEAALRSLGQPSPAGNHNSCIACRHGDPGYFATVAIWPLRMTSAAEPTYRACVRHLAEAIATLTQEAPA